MAQIQRKGRKIIALWGIGAESPFYSALGLSRHMVSFPTESQLLAALDRCDELVRLCAAGKISFSDFSAAYDSFYWSFPLDGHESDTAGLAVLAKYSGRIAAHQAVAETVLSKVCADADAEKEIYRMAGRFGSKEAVAKLRLVAAGLSGGEA